MKKGNLMITIVACVTLLASGLPGYAQSTNETVKWNYWVHTGPGHPSTKNYQNFANEVKKRTQGQLVITIRTVGELPYKGSDSLQVVGDNLVQIGSGYMGSIEGHIPLIGVTGLPFLVKNPSEVEQIWPILKEYSEREMEKFGVKVLFQYSWPIQHLYGLGKPIKNTEDFDGRKIRVTNMHLSEMMNRLDATPISVILAEVVVALQRGMFEGVVTSSFNLVGAKWAEFMKWAWMGDIHNGGPDFQMVNKDALAKLPPQVRATLLQVADEWAPKSLALVMRLDKEYEEELKNKWQLEMIYPDKAEIDKMTKIMVPYWQEWAKKRGPAAEELLGKIRKKLGR